MTSSDGDHNSQAVDSTNSAPPKALDDDLLAAVSRDVTSHDASSSVGARTALTIDCASTTASATTAEVKDNNSAAVKETPPTRLVIGRQQEPEVPAHLFQLKPCDKDGRDYDTSDAYLTDGGDDVLNLSAVRYLGLDWKNDEKSRPYVLVQSKRLVSHTANVFPGVLPVNTNKYNVVIER